MAAQQSLAYSGQVMIAAEAGAELAVRMTAAGNWSKLAEARERAFYLDALAQQGRARLTAGAARERLARALGLESSQTIQLPARLPDLPAALPVVFPDVRTNDAAAMEKRALAQRLDVQSSRRDVDSLARSLGLTRITRYVDMIDLGFVYNTEAPNPAQRGWELDLRLPIFDFGGARTARAENLYLQALNRARDTALKARSEVREAHAALRERFDLARRYRDEVLPLRKQVSEEMLLRYNGMMVSVFDLLADARGQVASVNAALEAERDYWLAESDYQMALTGLSGVAESAPTAAVTAAGSAQEGGH